MSKKQKDKSEFRKFIEANIVGGLVGTGATLPIGLANGAISYKAMKNIEKSLSDADYVYDANKIIAKHPKLKDVVVRETMPQFLKFGIPVGKEVPVTPGASAFAPYAFSDKGGIVFTPHKKGKVSAIGLHELGHASNLSDPTHRKLIQADLQHANLAAGLGSILAATQLGEDNPLAVGGTSGIIAALLANKANKTRFMEEAKASSKALNYVRAIRPDRIKKDTEILKTALGTYKRGLPLRALSLGIAPLAVAYARQRMNQGEFKKDKWLEKLIG